MRMIQGASTSGRSPPGRPAVFFSESKIETLVRPVGWRRLRQFAGSTSASNVAFRGITPDPSTAIQAVTGSGVDAGQVRGTRSIKKYDFLNVDRQ
ncbi:MAG: hypothetical protein JO243_02205 [Solirubrobacterales bacterium]|nr:hypothetical protein [Solirubrobacterales bacterium]